MFNSMITFFSLILDKITPYDIVIICGFIMSLILAIIFSLIVIATKLRKINSDITNQNNEVLSNYRILLSYLTLLGNPNPKENVLNSSNKKIEGNPVKNITNEDDVKIVNKDYIKTLSDNTKNIQSLSNKEIKNIENTQTESPKFDEINLKLLEKNSNLNSESKNDENKDHLLLTYQNEQTSDKESTQENNEEFIETDSNNEHNINLQHKPVIHFSNKSTELSEENKGTNLDFRKEKLKNVNTYLSNKFKSVKNPSSFNNFNRLNQNVENKENSTDPDLNESLNSSPIRPTLPLRNSAFSLRANVNIPSTNDSNRPSFNNNNNNNNNSINKLPTPTRQSILPQRDTRVAQNKTSATSSLPNRPNIARPTSGQQTRQTASSSSLNRQPSLTSRSTPSTQNRTSTANSPSTLNRTSASARPTSGQPTRQTASSSSLNRQSSLTSRSTPSTQNRTSTANSPSTLNRTSASARPASANSRSSSLSPQRDNRSSMLGRR